MADTEILGSTSAILVTEETEKKAGRPDLPFAVQALKRERATQSANRALAKGAEAAKLNEERKPRACPTCGAELIGDTAVLRIRGMTPVVIDICGNCAVNNLAEIGITPREPSPPLIRFKGRGGNRKQ